MTPEGSERHDGPVARRTLLRNEFALVEIGVERSASGPALRIRDTGTGRSIALDPLELEALTRLTHRDFGSFVCRDSESGDGSKNSL